jgi:hypothetical protein
MTIDFDEAYVSSEVEHAKQAAKMVLIDVLIDRERWKTILEDEEDLICNEDVEEMLRAIDLLRGDLIAWAKENTA